MASETDKNLGKLIEELVGHDIPIGSRINLRVEITGPHEEVPSWFNPSFSNPGVVAIKVMPGEYRTLKEMREADPKDCTVFFDALTGERAPGGGE